MIFLSLSILSGITIVICFKLIDRIGYSAFPAIIINYITAFLLGLFLTKKEIFYMTPPAGGEIIAALIIGILFIILFRILDLSVRTAGMGISTIAAKISVAIPITFSILYYHESLGMSKMGGILLALTSLFLTVYQKKRGKRHAFVLPVILFFGMGTVDTLVKYTQATYLQKENILVFSTFVFLISFLTGFIMEITERKKIRERISFLLLLIGVLLGIANLGSLYFFIRALDSDFLASSLIFTINNLGILILTVLTGVFFFRERLNPVNWFGFFLSLISLYIIFEG